jgi:DNA polymerase-1
MTSPIEPVFKEIWMVDFEFKLNAGAANAAVHCLVAKELLTGQKLRFWNDELLKMNSPPYSVGADSLFVAYYAAAEFLCHQSLGWDLPANVLDLCVEFKRLTSGLTLTTDIKSKRSLLGALMYFGCDAISGIEKEQMRELAIRGGPFSASEKEDLLSYCESDVLSLEKLFSKMAGQIDWPRAIFRGRYMKAVSKMERIGIPVDRNELLTLQRSWPLIERAFIEEFDQKYGYGIYQDGVWKTERFSEWLRRRDIPWPRLISGALDLKASVFRDMSKTHSDVKPLHALRATLSQMRESELEVGDDGYNRTALWAFGSKTGRNQPSTAKFIFGRAKWFRNLIRPKPGFALAYIDWSEQEFGIAAALSGDEEMKKAYASGDSYVMFAKQAGAIKSDTPADQVEEIRKAYKLCALGVQYGMGANGLALKINQSPAHAEALIQHHKLIYQKFWQWLGSAVDYAMLRKSLHTTFGWQVHVEQATRSGSLLNFPMQANGAEMMRLACILATEAGIRICAPIHDALLIEAPIEELAEKVAAAEDVMRTASRIILDGFELRSKVEVVRYPERMATKKDGLEMWDHVWRLVARLEGRGVGAHV